MKAAAGYTGAGEAGVAYDLQSNKYVTGIQLDSLGNGAVAIQKNSGAATIAVTAIFAGGSVDKDWLQVDTNAASPHKNHCISPPHSSTPQMIRRSPSRLPPMAERSSRRLRLTPNRFTPQSINSAILRSGMMEQFMSHGCAASPTACRVTAAIQ